MVGVQPGGAAVVPCWAALMGLILLVLSGCLLRLLL